MSKQDNVLSLSNVPEINDMLTETICQGAKTILAEAIRLEVDAFLAKHSHLKDAKDRRLVVRNGYLPERNLQTGIGKVPIKVPRVRNNSDEAVEFCSALLPPYLKRTESIDKLIPWLYLTGVSTGQMQGALSALLGHDCKGLSAKNITHLTTTWQSEYEAWNKRDLSDTQIVYAWADGIHLKARMDHKQCLLVIIGADETGKKHVLSIEAGERESRLSWQSTLLDLKKRGLKDGFKLAIGDGAMGFWSALSEVFPDARHQRCWVHKSKNVLNKLPKSEHERAK